jgi:hypothetical protein
MAEYYVLREGRKIVYEGSNLKLLKKKIQPSQKGLRYRIYKLSAVRINQDKQIDITYREVYQFKPDEEIYNYAISEVHGMPLNDLEKILEKIKANTE